MATSRVKTIDIDAGLLADTRDAMKPSAEAQDAEVVERALRFYLGRRALETSQAMSELTEEEAMQIANEGAARAAPRAPQRRLTRVVIDPGVLVSAFNSPRGRSHRDSAEGLRRQDAVLIKPGRVCRALNTRVDRGRSEGFG